MIPNALPALASHRRGWLRCGASLLLAVVAISAQAAVIPAGADTFGADASRIDFDEVPLGTANPIYTPADGAANRGSVSFGGYFSGQSLGNVAECGASTACVSGTPNAGLSLDLQSSSTVTVTDSASSNNPVLTGLPLFNGPISILFGADQAGIGLSVGFINAIGAERLTAFDREGNVLGSITNDALGYSVLALVTDDGSNDIAGVQLTATLAAEGFALENMLFGQRDQLLNLPSPGDGDGVDVAEPYSLGLFVLMGGLVALIALRRRRV
ncbi:PEP-CTERM sorting domain-containing protein [Salinisphaera orenii]|uniref:Exosortase n=1 Tax=Salinisphaera orenii YIM 95161 TaxID=1051139 RepID=A0A423Q037_9GAMM|nr:PEP-CTERM sorting domain-containing protein [Salinisphaera halophila]ROO31351.1 exosortase [Salinisphaera halophila YIM 95161]